MSTLMVYFLLLVLLVLTLDTELSIVTYKCSIQYCSSSNRAFADADSTVRYPNTRRFIPLPGIVGLKAITNIHDNNAVEPLVLRVQQFNVLADGLAALRPDLGRFSRVTKDVLDWETRKIQILHEITQYDADVITLQEVDHYYDWFLPQLSKLGYIGHFAPKPTSACLDVSGNNDGCAMFIRRNKLRVLSCETTTLALSIAGLNDGGELIEDDNSIKAQNQVGLIAVCEFNTDDDGDDGEDGQYNSIYSDRSYVRKSSPPPIILSTTHLKSSKSATGERYRQKGVLQILDEIDRIFRSLCVSGTRPVVVLTGDFNAVPEDSDYSPGLTYKAVKRHRLGLRSVYNEDVPLSLTALRSPEIYTTWKARSSKGDSTGEEVIVKRCIDYIFYGPYLSASSQSNRNLNENEGRNALTNKLPVIAFSPAQQAISILLRSAVYLFSAIIPSTSLIVSSLSLYDKIFVISLSVIGLAVFEIACVGTIFNPRVAVMRSENKAVSSDSPIISQIGKLIDITKVGGATGSNTQSTVPGIRAVSALDLYSTSDIGPALLPSETYPSDHLCIAADLNIVW